MEKFECEETEKELRAFWQPSWPTSVVVVPEERPLCWRCELQDELELVLTTADG
jgi:hypothetical protein